MPIHDRELREFIEDLLVEMEGVYDGALDSPTRWMGGWLERGRVLLRLSEPRP